MNEKSGTANESQKRFTQNYFGFLGVRLGSRRRTLISERMHCASRHSAVMTPYLVKTDEVFCTKIFTRKSFGPQTEKV